MTSAPIMMPMQPEAAAQQMLIEQVRRLTDGVDRLNSNLSDIREQLARMEAENAHTVERREKNEQRLAHVEARLGTLETWKTEQKTERSLIVRLLGSPIIGWIGGALISLLAVTKGDIIK